MEITSETNDRITVVKPAGSIDVVSRSRLKDIRHLHSLDNDVVFSLEEVNFLDSSGLSSLVQIIRNFRNADKQFVIAAPSPHVLTILQMTSIDQIVPIVATVQDAIDLVKEKQNQTE